MQYRTATFTWGDSNVAISATGNPNAVVTVQVGSQVPGTMQALYADFNTKVSKGQLIARIDPAALQAKWISAGPIWTRPGPALEPPRPA